MCGKYVRKGAHQRAKRRMGRYIRGSLEAEGDLSTLAAKTVITFVTGRSVNERTLISSVVLNWSLSNLTEAFSDGPIVCGIAHSDYSATEVEAYLENTSSWNEGDVISQEIAKRKIRRVGTFQTPAQALGIVTLNDGRSIYTKCNWILLQGQGITFWAYNSGTSALATTAAELTINGHANLWPR